MASNNLVACFYLLTTFKAFLKQSEPQADDISPLQMRKILTMHVNLHHMSVLKKKNLKKVKLFFLWLYKVALWAVLKNKLRIAPSMLFLANLVLITYPQGQLFSQFFHIIQVFYPSSLYIANNLKPALRDKQCLMCFL